jgi:hypothetical protein
MKKKSASKTAAKTIAKPAFPAKELERWFRSEVNQLTETVRGLQKDIERIVATPAKPVGRARATRVQRPKARTRHAARPTSVRTPK